MPVGTWLARLGGRVPWRGAQLALPAQLALTAHTARTSHCAAPCQPLIARLIVGAAIAELVTPVTTVRLDLHEHSYNARLTMVKTSLVQAYTRKGRARSKEPIPLLGRAHSSAADIHTVDFGLNIGSKIDCLSPES